LTLNNALYEIRQRRSYIFQFLYEQNVESLDTITPIWQRQGYIVECIGQRDVRMFLEHIFFLNLKRIQVHSVVLNDIKYKTLFSNLHLFSNYRDVYV